MDERRSRTLSWSDPGETLARARGLRGIEMLRRIHAGEIPYPPIAELLGMRLVDVSEGRVVWEAVPGEEYYNPIGTVHAGFATTLLDSAMGTAYVSLADAGTRWTTLELKANFTRAITADTGAGPLHGDGDPRGADGRPRRRPARGRRRTPPGARDEHDPRALP